MDLLPWVIRAVLIIVIWKGKREGRYQEYSIRFFTVGITAFIMGVILLMVSFMTDLSFDYDLFLAVAGAIVIIIGLVIRNMWE